MALMSSSSSRSFRPSYRQGGSARNPIASAEPRRSTRRESRRTDSGQAVEMTARGKPGKPTPGFPPFLPPLEIAPRFPHPPAPATAFLYKGDARNSLSQNPRLRVEQINAEVDQMFSPNARAFRRRHPRLKSFHQAIERGTRACILLQWL